MRSMLILATTLGILFTTALFGQTPITSLEENRYDFLALSGQIERPYLNYRTLSDSVWEEQQQWTIFDPELYSSYNASVPYGQNDGVLWQGRGLNTSATGGLRYYNYGLEITLKPFFTFSQNMDYTIMPSAYENEFGYIWAYSYGAGADAPQRFGDDPFADFSWGDTEVRYTWRTLTAGFGTQSPWLGPGRVNAIMHSNNAAPYPKVDLGLRKTPITVFGWNAGYLEGRLWAGYLSESDFFDSNAENDHNLISALSVAYAPSFLPGLTLFANRSYLAPWESESIYAVSSLFYKFKGTGGQDIWDQRASLGFDYLLPDAGIEVYAEAGLNDYGPGLEGYIRYPFHSLVYTTGIRKTVQIPFLNETAGELVMEASNLELSQDFQFQWPATFYMHHQIVQGYTNDGQWLGAGIGTGGNSQYVGFSLFGLEWSSSFFIKRVNPDNDYLYRLTVGTENTTEVAERIEDFRADLSFGTSYSRVFSSNFAVSVGIVITQINNRYYESISWSQTDKEMNFTFTTNLKYLIN